MILLQAEILELQADPYQMAKGTVVEARLDKAKGPLATVLIQRGTLKVGDPFVAGSHYGRVRAMFDHRGRKMESANPSTPVEVLGFTSVPEAGDTFIEVADERKARQISNVRQEEQRVQQLSQNSRITLDDLYRRISAGDVKDLNLIIKGDVQGSVQALWEAIEKIESDKVQTRLIHGSTGGYRMDINLASASNAIVSCLMFTRLRRLSWQRKSKLIFVSTRSSMRPFLTFAWRWKVSWSRPIRSGRWAAPRYVKFFTLRGSARSRAA